MLKPVRLEQNSDGTWTAYILFSYFTGTKEECERWIRFNGEEI